MRCAACGEENPERAKFCLNCGAPLAPQQEPGGETRKVVTIVFADMAGSTAIGERLDPEALRRVQARYFDGVTAVLERHGGTVEKYIGDAVMAVFGIPKLHEDDPLRAVRAATEMQTAIERLNDDLQRDHGVEIAIRIGVNTGEVVSSEQHGDQRLVTGDTVNVAARLEQAAGVGEVLLGDTTYRLVRDAVRVEPVEPLELKGKTNRVPAFQLREVLADVAGHVRHLDSPMVGRNDELMALEALLDRVAGEASCQLVTVYGDPGIGKSRLVDEFARRQGTIRILKGRCLPYGDGITYWPIAEAVRAASDIREGDGSADVRRKLSALLGDAVDGARIVEGIAEILGLADVELSQGETLWSTRRLMETLAEQGPVVLIVEDIHWAESTLLDLLESIADWSRGSRLLMLCTARPDVFEIRSGWGGGRSNAATIELRPLSADDTGRLIENLVHHRGLDDGAKGRIGEAAEGNPLFVEQFLSMLIDGGLLHQEGGSWSLSSDMAGVALPTTIQTLLGARLDSLPPLERSVLGVASVIGRVFDVETLEALVPEGDRDPIPGAVDALVRKDLVRPERGPQGDGFRFRHVLILNATYRSLPKRVRAELHESVAARMDVETGEQSAGYDEIIGHHLERAAHYRSELGPVDEHVRDLRTRAGRRLSSAGGRAAARGDMPAAVSLYTAAAALLPSDDAKRLAFLPELGTALVEVGRMEAADEVFAEAIDAGMERHDLGVVGDALMYRFEEQVFAGRWVEAETSVDLATELLPQAEAAGHIIAQQRVWSIRGIWDPSCAREHEYTERALGLAVRVDDSRGLRENIQVLCGLAAYGPTRVDVALARLEEFQRMTAGDRVMQAAIVVTGRAALLAMADRIDEARDGYESARATFRELGLNLWLGAEGTLGAAMAELTAGDPLVAEALLHDAISRLQRISERGSFLTSVSWLLVRTLLRLGKLDAAETTFARWKASADERSLWYGSSNVVEGALLVHRGRAEEGVVVIRSALARLDPGWLVRLGDGLALLADALRAAGRGDEARAAAHEALEVFERKGDIPSARRARAFLDGSSRFWES